MDDRSPNDRLAALRAYADKGPSVSRSDVAWVLGELERRRGRPAATQGPVRGRWRTGRSVEPRVTLYRDDQIAGLALTAELAAEIVERCNESTMTEMPPCYIDADAGECATERAVVEALMDVGPWDEIDGDGDPGSILADHIRQLPRIIRDECEG